MADDQRKDTNGILREIRDELKKSRTGDGKNSDEIQDELKDSGRAMVQAIAHGDVLAQKELKTLRDTLKKQLAVQIAFDRAAALRAKQAEAEAGALQDSTDGIQENSEDQLDPADISKGVFAGLRDFLGIDFGENLKKAFDKIAGAGRGAGAKIGGGIKKISEGIWDAIKIGLSLIAGFIALEAFLEGFQKANKWFGENADFGDKFAAGLANIIGTFVGLDEADTKGVALAIGGFIDAVAEVVSAIGDVAFTLASALILGDWNAEEIFDAFSNLADAIWENKEVVLATAALLFPGGTFKVAMMAMKGAWIAFSALIPAITASAGAISTALTPVLIPLAAIIGIALTVANLFNAFSQSFTAFKDEWEKSGSVMSALKVAVIEFAANFIGAPLAILRNITAWVAEKLGFVEFAAVVKSFDPITAIKDGLTVASEFITSAFTGLADMVSGWMDAIVNGVKEHLPDWMKSDDPVELDDTVQGKNAITESTNGITLADVVKPEVASQLKPTTPDMTALEQMQALRNENQRLKEEAELAKAQSFHDKLIQAQINQQINNNNSFLQAKPRTLTD